jgi:large subunit ribosomal protein L18
MTQHVRTQEIRKWERRQRRAWHSRDGIYGTAERPRLSVYRSHRHFHAQLIDDTQGRTLASASTMQKDVREAVKNGGDKKAAGVVGEKLAKAAVAAGIKKVVFDRNFYQFHGRVRAFAEAAAKGGLDFLSNPKKKGKAPKVKKEKVEAKPVKEGKKPKEGKPQGGGSPKEQKKEEKA